MKKKITIVIITLLLISIAALAFLYVGTHKVDVLDPKGVIAMKQRKLFVTSALLMLIVVLPVLVMTFIFSWRYGADKDKSKYSPDWGHSNTAEIVWWGVPFVIIFILSIMVWRTSHELNPFKPLESNKKPLEIQVVALEWKWLFIYPEQGIATVNYLQFPEKTPINFEISGQSPMNSLWIPQLGGMIYAMPAMRTKLHLMADETGEYQGRSGHFSGKGFAGMYFNARSSTEEEFEKWVRSVKSQGKTLNFGVYKELAKPSEYVPVIYYSLGDTRLFDQIVSQYDPPQKKLKNN